MINCFWFAFFGPQSDASTKIQSKFRAHAVQTGEDLQRRREVAAARAAEAAAAAAAAEAGDDKLSPRQRRWLAEGKRQKKRKKRKGKAGGAMQRGKGGVRVRAYFVLGDCNSVLGTALWLCYMSRRLNVCACANTCVGCASCLPVNDQRSHTVRSRSSSPVPVPAAKKKVARSRTLAQRTGSRAAATPPVPKEQLKQRTLSFDVDR